MRFRVLIGISACALAAFSMQIIVIHKAQGREGSKTQTEIEKEREEEGIDGLIKKLWSSDEKERQSAKKKLEALREKAVPPLISLLKDVTEKNEPRFVTGKESEGVELLKHFHENGNQLSDQFVQKMREIEISSRLKRDVMELLCHIKAEEAIPVIIGLLKDREMVLGKKNEEKNALLCFGPVAVPKLIEAIEAVQNSPAFIDAQLKGGQNFYEGMYLIRLLIALGNIGDDRALRPVEELLHQTTDKNMRTLIVHIIKQLKRKKAPKR